MLNVKLICVGKLKEKFYLEAVNEYVKRLGSLCRLEITELGEVRLPQEPSQAEINAALAKEAESIRQQIPKGAVVAAMCIEGKIYSSEEFSKVMSDCAVAGASKLCFVVGSSFGLDEGFKKSADLRLSMSKMTFPHHLARVMLLEQIYRGFKISAGGKYHK